MTKRKKAADEEEGSEETDGSPIKKKRVTKKKGEVSVLSSISVSEENRKTWTGSTLSSAQEETQISSFTNRMTELVHASLKCM